MDSCFRRCGVFINLKVGVAVPVRLKSFTPK